MTTSYIRDLHLAGPGSQPGDQDDGGEDEGLAAALDAADEGLEPLRKIAALPLETQAQVQRPSPVN